MFFIFVQCPLFTFRLHFYPSFFRFSRYFTNFHVVLVERERCGKGKGGKGKSGKGGKWKRMRKRPKSSNLDFSFTAFPTLIRDHVIKHTYLVGNIARVHEDKPEKYFTFLIFKGLHDHLFDRPSRLFSASDRRLVEPAQLSPRPSVLHAIAVHWSIEVNKQKLKDNFVDICWTRHF